MAALLAGINPDIAVNKIDIRIIIPAVAGVKFAIPVTTPPDILAITIFATISYENSYLFVIRIKICIFTLSKALSRKTDRQQALLW